MAKAHQTIGADQHIGTEQFIHQRLDFLHLQLAADHFPGGCGGFYREDSSRRACRSRHPSNNRRSQPTDLLHLPSPPIGRRTAQRS